MSVRANIFSVKLKELIKLPPNIVFFLKIPVVVLCYITLDDRSAQNSL